MCSGCFIAASSSRPCPGAGLCARPRSRRPHLDAVIFLVSDAARDPGTVPSRRRRAARRARDGRRDGWRRRGRTPRRRRPQPFVALASPCARTAAPLAARGRADGSHRAVCCAVCRAGAIRIRGARGFSLEKSYSTDGSFVAAPATPWAPSRGLQAQRIADSMNARAYAGATSRVDATAPASPCSSRVVSRSSSGSTLLL